MSKKTIDTRPLWMNNRIVTPAAIAVIVWIFLSVCLGNQFTNWDDPQYVLQNPLVKDYSASGIMAIFSCTVLGNYHPFTILSYAADHYFAAEAPGLYHLHNLLLHIVATLLVYWFVQLLTKRPVAATVTALLFGLHPMHVESVAWISGRKDLLCAIYYLLSCMAYLQVLRTDEAKKMQWNIACFLLFAAAALSKPIAVTLPLTLLLIEWFEGRPIGGRSVVQKIPYFILALVFGVIAVKTQNAYGAVNSSEAHFSVIERIALPAYATITYLWKTLLPVHLCCFYPYPQKVNGSLPGYYYLYLPGVALLAWVVFWYLRKNRVVLFGSIFFLVNIALLLQLIPVGNALIADRYTYIPYIGLFFIAGWYVSVYYERCKGVARNAVILLATACLCLLGYMSHERSKVWTNTATLWTDALEKEPAHVRIAYDNLSSFYFDKWYNATEKGERDRAYDSTEYLLKRYATLWPDTAATYRQLGMLYFSKKKYEATDSCFRTAVRLHPTAEEHTAYGNVLVMVGKPDSALSQFDLAIDKNTDQYATYLSRGKILLAKKRWDEAMKDLNAAIAIDAGMGELYYVRSFCDTQMLGKQFALRDVEHALLLGYKNIDSNYYNSLKAK